MAHTQDIEHQQATLNSSGPLGSEKPGLHAQITDPDLQVRQHQLVCVEVAILQAHSIPHIKNRFGGKTRFYVTIAHNTTTRKTEGVQIEGQTVQWDQKLDAFFIQPPSSSSRLILCLYAKSLARRDILIGKCEIPVEPQINVPFVLSNGDAQVGQSMEAVTLYLTITVNEALVTLPTDPVDLVVKQAPLNPCTCVLNGCILCLSVLGSVVF